MHFREKQIWIPCLEMECPAWALPVPSVVKSASCDFLSNREGSRVQWDSWRRLEAQLLGGQKEPETTTQYMLLFSPPPLCAHPSTVWKLLLTLSVNSHNKEKD